MNLISRIRSLCLRSVSPLQQSNVYSTKITYATEKFQHLTDRRTQESSESSSSFSDRIGKQTVRPKPIEVPYQGKVANSVNLIGYVKSPIQFEADSNGNHFAATVIYQETNGEKDPLLIPVVFEGDLAHVVAYHVKENSHVLVSGKLSSGRLRFAFSGSVMKFHVVADNLNFVEGFKRKFAKKSFSDVGIEKQGDGKKDNLNFVEGFKRKFAKKSFSDVGIEKQGDGKKDNLNFVEGFKRKFAEKSFSDVGIEKQGDGKTDNLNFVEGFKRKFAEKSFSDVGIEKQGDGKIEESIRIGDDDDDKGFNRKWMEALEYAKVKRWGENLESKPEE